MRQTLEYNENNHFFVLNGNCIQLGTFNDVRNSEVSKSESMEIVFNFKNAEKNVFLELKYTLKEDGKDDSCAIVDELIINSNWYFRNRGEFTSKTVQIKSEQQGYKEHFIDAKKSYPAPSNVIQRFPFLFFQPNKDRTEKQRVSDIFNTFQVHYIAADRIGPQNFFVKSNLDKFVNVGPKGEYTANVLAKRRKNLVNKQLY